MIFYLKFLIIILSSLILQSYGQLFNNLLSSSNSVETQGSSSWNPLNWFQTEPEEIVVGDYNPDADLSTTEIAIRHGYSAESHTVKTEDGYLLTLHRIPCGRLGCKNGRGRGQPVFLQHGLLSSSADWLLSGPDRALAFLLADAGYDVWLGNARGNTYSRRHIKMSNEESKFWEFSWHEMAIYDIPSEIDYIYDIKNIENQSIENSDEVINNLLYIGHSMGTTMAFALLSEKPEYNHKIKAVFALAPVAFMSNVKSPIRLLAPFSKDIEMIARFFGANEFLPQNKILKFLAKYGCELTDTERYICENTVFVLCGFDKEQFNATLMPVILAHTPAGTSTKTVIHYAQEIHEGGNFQQFDYGMEKNRIRYGQDSPPKYNLENVQVPVTLFYATNDWLAGPHDVLLLHNKLHTTVEMYQIPNINFNHVDFLWGNNVTNLVYTPLIERMTILN